MRLFGTEVCVQELLQKIFLGIEIKVFILYTQCYDKHNNTAKQLEKNSTQCKLNELTPLG